MLLSHAGLSSAASSLLFYAARVSDVPAVFAAEPDDILVLSGKVILRSCKSPDVLRSARAAFCLLASHPLPASLA